jgi:hypothetical protein
MEHVHLGDDKLSEQDIHDVFDLVITPDARYGRYLLQEERRNRRVIFFLGLLLMVTSVGALAADSAWSLAGLFGLPFGAMGLLAAVINGPRRILRRNPELLAPRQYVFTADAIEWRTTHASSRVSWNAIKHASRSSEAYRLDRVDTNQPAYLCRTTLTSEQDARLAAYLDGRLATRSAATTPETPSP